MELSSLLRSYVIKYTFIFSDWFSGPLVPASDVFYAPMKCIESSPRRCEGRMQVNMSDSYGLYKSYICLELSQNCYETVSSSFLQVHACFNCYLQLRAILFICRQSFNAGQTHSDNENLSIVLYNVLNEMQLFFFETSTKKYK